MYTIRYSLLAAFVLAIPSAAFGEAFIDYVSPVGGAQGFSPGSFAELEGGYFDSKTTVQVGGLQAAVVSVDLTVLSFQLPAGLTPGPATIVVTSGGVNSEPYAITLDAYSPGQAIGSGTYLVERVLPGGGFAPVTCSPGGTPKAGNSVRIYVSGLGATEPAVPAGIPSPSTPLARTLGLPSISVGGQAAEVMESVLAPGQIGVYRVTFKVPPGDGYYDITLSIGGKTYPSFFGLPLAVGNAIKPPFWSSPESIQMAPACGGVVGNAGQVLTGDPKNPLTTLGGITAKVRDSQGIERLAPVLYAAADRVDYIVPPGSANGRAAVTITTTDGTVSSGSLDVQTVAPSALEVAPGIPAAYVVRVRDDVQTVEPVFQINASGRFEIVPIDLGPPTDQVFLVLFGTGFRFRQTALVPANLSTTGIRLSLALPVFPSDILLPAEYAGQQGEYAGVDQMNVRMPRSLAGVRGNLFLRVDGKEIGVANGFSFK